MIRTSFQIRCIKNNPVVLGYSILSAKTPAGERNVILLDTLVMLTQLFSAHFKNSSTVSRPVLTPVFRATSVDSLSLVRRQTYLHSKHQTFFRNNFVFISLPYIQYITCTTYKITVVTILTLLPLLAISHF